MIKLNAEKIKQIKNEYKSGLITLAGARTILVKWVAESFLDDMPVEARVAVRATKDSVAVEVLDKMLEGMIEDPSPVVFERFKSICLLIHLIKGN